MTRLFRPWVATGLALVLGIGALAAENSSPVDRLREALHAESLGVTQLRQEAGDSPLAQAYLGKIRHNDEWLSIDEAVARLSKDDRLGEYRERQARIRDNSAEHISLADWCARRGLLEQEKAHVLRALDFEPDNEQLRRRVGHVRGKQQWQSAEDVTAQQEDEQKLAAAEEQWLSTLQNLADRLSHGNRQERAAAEKSIRGIRDPLAIPSLEEVLVKGAHPRQHLLLETLGEIDDPRAAAALVRLAVDSESQSVRSAAALQLKQLDAYSYVPLLLSGLRGPISATSVLRQDNRKKLVYSQNLRRAAEDYDEVMELEVVVNRRGHTAGKSGLVQGVIRQRANEEDADLQTAVAKENGKIEERNARIIAVLEATTGKRSGDLPGASVSPPSSYLASGLSASAAPQPWWNWWKQENEVSERRTRGVVTFHRTSAVVLSDRAPYDEPDPIPSSFRSSSEFQSPRVEQRCECFVAGTPVWTARGQIAIEQIRTGERVLTQNLQTGELEFKAVIRPTTRPAMPLVRVTIGNDVLDCTGGHLFWVVEQGWVKARDLKPGLVVHGAQGSSPVSDNEAFSSKPTFNLVVSDNHNYFVGQSRLLTHDNSPRRATTLVAPGVTAEE